MTESRPREKSSEGVWKPTDEERASLLGTDVGKLTVHDDKPPVPAMMCAVCYRPPGACPGACPGVCKC
jgi:hypothetical protein